MKYGRGYKCTGARPAVAFSQDRLELLFNNVLGTHVHACGSNSGAAEICSSFMRFLILLNVRMSSRLFSRIRECSVLSCREFMLLVDYSKLIQFVCQSDAPDGVSGI